MSSLKENWIVKINGDDRLTTFPISRPGIWKFYKQQLAQFWVVEEVQFGLDKRDYQEKLSEGQRLFVDNALTLFATMDKIININIVEKFSKMFSVYEIDLYYNAQTAIENIHGEAYSLMIETYIVDDVKKAAMLDAWVTHPVIAQIAKWIRDVYESDNMSAAEALFRIVLIEGVIFPTGFVPIYWITDSSTGLMKGLGHANELIARDETLHKLFGTYMQLVIREPIKQSAAESIVREIEPICDAFAETCLPVDLPEMNKKMLCEYIRCLLDTVLIEHGFSAIYNVKNPFAFMEKILLNNKTNFFERSVSEYNKPRETRRYEVDRNF